MGTCVYCSKPAGLFRRKHKECEARFLLEKRQREQEIEADKNELQTLASAAARGQGKIEAVGDQLKNVSDTLDELTCRRILIDAWGNAVERFLEDGILTVDEESTLMEFSKAFSLTQDDLARGGAYTKVVQAAVLRDLVEGRVPDRMQIDGALPFNFKKNEKVVWLFKDVHYFEQKTSRSFVGGSRGVSIRIARGVYYRVGAFKGQHVERTENVHVDTGMLVVTDQHLYFGGFKKSFRVPYGKIVSIMPYSDGIGIQRDAATAKPQSFIVGDGWFINNIVSNLAQH